MGHLNTHSNLIRDSPDEKAKALGVASRIGSYKSCDRCGKLSLKAIEVGNEHICHACHRKIPKPDKIKSKLTAHRRQLITDRIRDANQTRFRIMDDIPAKLRRLWGQCVHSVLDRYASARTDEDALNALEAWAKLKVVLITPVRGGRQKRESKGKTHRRMMIQWLTGDIEECWNEGLRIEQIRKSHHRNRNRRRGQRPEEKNGATYTTTEERRKRDSAKRLANIGEYRKAMSALLSNGTATITDSVLDQLRKKHPPRTKPITRPRPPYAESENRDHNDDSDDEWDMQLPPAPSENSFCPSPTQVTGASHPNSSSHPNSRNHHRERS